MKSTGVIRRIDELGRIVIPMEIRNQFDISVRDSLEIFVDESNIIIKKVEESCIFCGNTKDLIKFKGKLICKNCTSSFKEQIGTPINL